MNYFVNLMSPECFKSMPETPAISIKNEQNKEAYEVATYGKLDDYFNYVLFQCIVCDDNKYIPLYDLYTAVVGNLIQFLGNVQYVKFKSMLVKWINNQRLKPYCRKHYVPNHEKPILCLDNFAVDEKKYYELIEKFYKVKIADKDKLPINFNFTINCYQQQPRTPFIICGPLPYNPSGYQQLGLMPRFMPFYR